MNIKIKKIIPQVYLLTFDTQYELCMSLIRWQEFYESPKFKGKYFELEEFIDYWCKKFGNGSFTYPSTWNGFNLPGKLVVDWLNIMSRSRCSRDREVEVLKKLWSAIDKDGMQMDQVYIIANHKEDNKDRKSHVVDHELAHALYYLYPEYKKKCNKLLKGVFKKDYKDGEKQLLKWGYCKRVIKDELQAYFSVYNTKHGMGPKLEFCKNFSVFVDRLKNS